MSISNRHVSHYKYFNPLPQKRNSAGNFHMPNVTAEEIFQAQNISIKTLENKVSELLKQIKEIKIENKTLLKTNTLQEKELKKANESSTGIPFLTQSYKEEIRVIQSKVSSLQDQLKISEHKLRSQEKIVLRKSLQIANLTTVKRQYEKQIKEIAQENKELKKGKESVYKKYQDLLDVNKDLKLENEELKNKVEQMTCKDLELKNSLRSSENNKAQLEEDLNELKKSYNELEQKFSMPKQCTMVVAQTQTEDISNPPFSIGSKLCLKKSEVLSDMLNARGDFYDESGYIGTNGIQEENGILASDSICKAKHSGFYAYQNEFTHPLPKIQKSLLKPIRYRSPHSLKNRDNESHSFPIDSSYIMKPFVSSNGHSVSSHDSQSNYSSKNFQAVKYISQKMC